MKSEYFIVRICYDREGNTVPGTYEIIDHIKDADIIVDAEHNHTLRKAQGKGSQDDVLAEGTRTRKRKSIRPTIPEMPAARRAG